MASVSSSAAATVARGPLRRAATVERGGAERRCRARSRPHQVERPDDAAGQFERRHAEIVHGGDTRSDHRAAGGAAQARRVAATTREPA